MTKVITKVLVRIGDHDVLFAANKDGVLADNILIPNENGLEVIRDHYGYNGYGAFNCFLENTTYLVGTFDCLDENTEYLVDGDNFLIAMFGNPTIIDTTEGDE